MAEFFTFHLHFLLIIKEITYELKINSNLTCKVKCSLRNVYDPERSFFVQMKSSYEIKMYQPNIKGTSKFGKTREEGSIRYNGGTLKS